MKLISNLKLSLVLFGLITFIGLTEYYTFDYYFKLLRFQPMAQYIVIDRGQSSTQIATTLVQKNIFPNRLMIILNILMHDFSHKLKAGEYLIPRKFSLQQVLELIAAGQTALHPITIPEGLTTNQIQDLLNHHPLLTGSAIPQFPEGTLMPETYLIPRNMPRIKLVQLMKQAMDQYLRKVVLVNNSHLNVNQVIVLASIVEKETAQSDERTFVASVFLNRLKINMPLQSDPTVIYALSQPSGKPYLNELSRKDLKLKHPFNTYTNIGLPPQPICHPGKASITAVLNPAKTSYLYFVADGTGRHIFSSSLAQHIDNHRNWRRIRSKIIR